MGGVDELPGVVVALGDVLVAKMRDAELAAVVVACGEMVESGAYTISSVFWVVRP